MMTRKGFSLVELLVVIAVIGIMISIVAGPVFSRTIAITQRAMCGGNLHHLSTILRAAREGQRERGEWQAGKPPFVDAYKWPGTVSVEAGSPERVFLCPSDDQAAGGIADPPLQFRTAMYPNPLLPFDPDHFSCVKRTIVENGETYTEYCVEDNLGVKAEWEYAMGVKEYSTNDGIWRIFNEWQGGRRKVVLTFYNCWWQNQIWVNGEYYADLQPGCAPMTLYFDDAVTSYGYNMDLPSRFDVGPDTIVLLDYPKAHVDATQSEIYERLNSDDSGRHLGKHNVLRADGSVTTVGTASLYPDVNPGQWTADPND